MEKSSSGYGAAPVALSYEQQLKETGQSEFHESVGEAQAPSSMALKVAGLHDDGLAPGTEARKRIEKRLKLKLDLRFSILIVIYSAYILRYVLIADNNVLLYQFCGLQSIKTSNLGLHFCVTVATISTEIMLPLQG